MLSTQDQLTAAIAAQRGVSIYKAGTPPMGAGTFLARWFQAGNPGAGAVSSAGLAGEQVTASTQGAIPFVNAISGKLKYLSGFELNSSVIGCHLLYDRLWQNSGIVVTTTTMQALASVGLPARDNYGTANGDGVEAWLEVQSLLGNAAVTGALISYTNESGVSGRVGAIDTIPAAAKAGTTVPISLQAGDRGVKTVDSITLGTSLVSGSVGIVLRRKLSAIYTSAPNIGDYRNFFDIGQVLYDGTALEIVTLYTSVTASNLFGQVCTIEG